MIVMAPISVGELIDKITILGIKQELLTDPDKLYNVDVELRELGVILRALKLPDIADLQHQLRMVNRELWHIEDYKRNCERTQEFGDGFVNAARQVYLKNDLRAKIKRDINIRCGSNIVEEKSYGNI